MELNFKKVGAGEPLIILHGLFGSLDNWMTLAKKWSEHYEVFVLDARNHGFSPHSNEFNYGVMADDLYGFIVQHMIHEPIILGHSMGGKTAMQFALNYPTQLSKLIVADIAPKQYPVHHDSIIAALESLDFTQISSRGEADNVLAQKIEDLSTRQFLLKNLHWKEKGRLDWKFNLPVIKENIVKIGQSLHAENPFEKPTLFIRGTRSNYILDEDADEIARIFEQSSIKSMDTGHWVHAENPAQFYGLVNDFLET